MTSTVQSGDSLTSEQRSEGTVNDGTIQKEVGIESIRKTNAQIKQGVYIALEDGSLVPMKPGTLIQSSSAASRPKDQPIKISQTVTLSPNCIKKALSAQSVPLNKSGNICVKRIVSKRPITIKKALHPQNQPGGEIEKNTEETLDPINTKDKPGNELHEQRKKFKSGSLTDFFDMNYFLKSPDDFQDSNLDNNRQEDPTHKDFLESSAESGGSSPEYIYDTLEDEDGENLDHDYSLHENVGNKSKLFENDEDLSEEYESEVMEDQIIKKSLQEGLIKNSKKDKIEDKGGKNSTQDSISPFKIKQCVQLKTLQSNNFKITGTKNQGKQTSCTSQIDDVGSYGVKKVHHGSSQSKTQGVNSKFPELPVPTHINQYGDCLKTRLGRYHYGLTLNDPPCQFFQGVLKGSSGQTLAAMFGDVNLLAKMESIPSNEIGHFMIDTTFKVIGSGTEGVNQVFTISLIHQKLTIPVWYAITSCSSTELYKRILIEFQQHVLDWPFTSVLVNNDPALCSAVRAVFPDIDLYGSWFYYCYSIWKELNLHHLLEQCKEEDSVLLTAVKLLMVVPYLPPSMNNNPSLVTMVDGFQYVRDFARQNNLPKDFNRVLDYVAVFWFNKVKAENFTLFGKHTCTMNHVEVLQLFLLSYMKQNGNVWILTRSFQSIARLTYLELIRFLNGKRQIPRNRGKKFNLPIRLNIKKLMAGSLDVKTYLEKSTIYLEEMLDIFLHPLYPATTFEKTNYVHTEGWAVRICSD